MLRLELIGIVLLCSQTLTEHRDYHYGPRNQLGDYRGGGGGHHHGTRTREIHTKYGRLRGTVLQPKADHLQMVDVYLGIPYAAAPVKGLRFLAPAAPIPWNGVRNFNTFAPVCPQVLPNTEEEIDNARHQYLKLLLPYLQNQSEDCLHLNIYAPHQNHSQRGTQEKYPVMVFIHGESYEWNSGNPYDGSVLAAYGNVVFVTVNFRLGILGFLRPGTRDETPTNFGLWDQVAALQWLKDNIDPFGGDPNNISVIGHGTGAVFAHLLLLSPVSTERGLFKRAILMSGSALNPDALGKAPLQITEQVAFALNCRENNTDEALVNCLRKRQVSDLLNVKIDKPRYVPAFAPLVDNNLVRDNPANLMKDTDRLSRFDLLYGVTELEKFHMLPGIALLEGLTVARRDELIRDSVKATHELEPHLILRKVLEHYGSRKGVPRPGQQDEWNRDLALEVISDSGIVGPMIATANLHSRANPKSYMYVFSHLRTIRDKLLQELNVGKTVHGEELPYVLGVPMNGEGHHLSNAYDRGEAMLSKAMMDWWCNFAYYGNPNQVRTPPRHSSYRVEGDPFFGPSLSYHIDWPEYDSEDQAYFNLTTPPQIGREYRSPEMEFWNEKIPRLLRRTRPPGELPVEITATWTPVTGMTRYYGTTTPFKVEVLYGQPPANISTEKAAEEQKKQNITKADDNSSNDSSNGGSSGLKNTSAVSLVIGFGVVFLLINATVLLYLYHKRQRMRKKAASGNPLARDTSRNHASGSNSLGQEATLAKRFKTGKNEHHRELGYCSASKPDIREIIKNDKAYDNNSNFGRRSRENSSSTIDTRIKVREWIQQEIVQRCSPRFLRKTRETLQREHREKLMQQQQRHLDTLHTDDEQEVDEEERRRRIEEAMYEENKQIRVRPGVRKQQPTKVSIAIDATPATRTDSILNQIPIELARAAGESSEYLDTFGDAATTILGTSEYCEPAEFQPGEVVNLYPQPLTEQGSPSSLPSTHFQQQASLAAGGSTTLPRLLTFGLPPVLSPLPPPSVLDINVTSLEPNDQRAREQELSVGHDEALRTIRRRNYPKVLPDIEKRRSLPPNASFVLGTLPRSQTHPKQPPSPPPRVCGTSRSLDCVEDKEEEEEVEEEKEEKDKGSLLPVKTDLHVGPLRKKVDSPKNQSVPSLTGASDISQPLSNAASLPFCPIHGTFRQVITPAGKNEQRIVIAPRMESNQELSPSLRREDSQLRSVDQPDCPTRMIPERGTKLPRIIIKPTTFTTGTLPRSASSHRTHRAAAPVTNLTSNHLHDNETYQRLLARREKMPLPGELAVTRIPLRQERTEVVQRVNMPDAAVTKL